MKSTMALKDIHGHGLPLVKNHDFYSAFSAIPGCTTRTMQLIRRYTRANDESMNDSNCWCRLKLSDRLIAFRGGISVASCTPSKLTRVPYLLPEAAFGRGVVCRERDCLTCRGIG